MAFRPRLPTSFQRHLASPNLLFAKPEHKTMLPGGTRESQSDILALVRHKGGLATYTVEGKVEEAFGETVAD